MDLQKFPPSSYFDIQWTSIESKVAKPRGAKFRRNASIGLLVATILGGSGIAAYAVQGNLSAAEQEDSLDAWVSEFHDVAAGVGAADEEGWPAEYGDMKLDPATGTLEVFWVGVPPADVADFLANPTSGFEVRLVSTPYGIAELSDAGRAILDADNSKRFANGTHITRVRPAAGRTGLVVEYSSESRLDVAAIEAIRSKAELAAGIPVLEISVGEELGSLVLPKS